jgi:hypothetical protein
MRVDVEQPIDVNGQDVPVLGFGGVRQLAYSAASDVKALAANTEVVTVYATSDVFLKAGGDASVEATSADDGSDLMLPGGVLQDWVLPANTTHIAALRRTVDGVLFVNKRI